MAKQLEVKIALTFTKTDDKLDVDTNGVPTSMILEALNNLTKFFAQQLVKEAQEEVPDNPTALARYLQGRLDTDRETLRNLLEE